MDKKVNVLERLYPKINKDKNIVYMPNGFWADWSQYGKNVEDAIDYFNDAKYVENLGIGIGMILGTALIGGTAFVIHKIKKHKEKKQEESEESEEEA